MLLASCASDTGGDDRRTPSTLSVHFYVQAPTPDTKTRIGDPGESTGEAVDWDRIAVIVAYKDKDNTHGGYDPEPGRMVYWDVFTRDEFCSAKTVHHTNSTLTPVLDGDADTGIRSFTMPLVRGTVRIYGITYSSPNETANAACKQNLVDFEQRLNNIKKDGADHNPDITDWQIANTYASTDATVKTIDVGKFLSVATGYAVDAKDAVSPQVDLSVSDDTEESQYWSMTLHRLATKLDVQWDAQSAYDNKQQKYVDVEVDGFTYNGQAASATGAGNGRLFPFGALLYSGHTFAPLGGSVDFFNTSAISRRNGRVYHYLFPDGCTDRSSAPTIAFHIKTFSEGQSSAEGLSRDYTMNFGNQLPLQPAAWYKINSKIKGNSSATTDITIGGK